MAATKSRTRKLTVRHKKKVVRTTKRIPGSFRILGRSLRYLWTNRLLFGGIVLVYALLYLLLARGLAGNFQLTETRKELEEVLGDRAGGVTTAATLFGVLLGSGATTTGDAGGVYQGILFVLMSLAVIWVLRQSSDARTAPGLKAAFYQGMHPLIPYILVGLVIILQLVPALLGVVMYGVVSANGIAVGPFENILWVLILIMSVALSMYLVSSSLFASYIVTLPGMTPLKALRTARKLVRFRRFAIIRKVLFLPLAAALAAVAVFFPLVLFATAVAEPVFLLCMLLLVPVAHAYYYTLYRELL